MGLCAFASSHQPRLRSVPGQSLRKVKLRADFEKLTPTTSGVSSTQSRRTYHTFSLTQLLLAPLPGMIQRSGNPARPLKVRKLLKHLLIRPGSKRT
jgi:hypothetical protein